MRPRKFIIQDETLKDILTDSFSKVYLSLIPFTAGIFFTFYQNPVWLIFLLVPLITPGDTLKRGIKKYL